MLKLILFKLFICIFCTFAVRNNTISIYEKSLSFLFFICVVTIFFVVNNEMEMTVIK